MNRSGICPYCGTSVTRDSRFCGSCGRRLDEGAYQSRAEPEQPWGGQEHEEPAYQDMLAGMGTRTGGFLVSQLIPGLVGWIPIVGWLAGVGVLVWSLFLFQRGQDIGARLLGMRVVRDTGDLAGFFHMWTRNLASIISLIVLGAGYWTAYFDPHRQTWHDKMLGTYVVEDTEEIGSRPGTSSSAAVMWFWISVIPFALHAALSIATVVGAFWGGIGWR